ncbi:MFS transporter [Halobacteriales archaeon QS_4_69_34]|nr:MAG: MFS transporter [Halobacteriales archaeon QS_4_69_34]
MTGHGSAAGSPAGDDPSNPRGVRAQWGLVAGASLVSTALGAYEIAPASVTPLVRESLSVGATAAGLLVGVMFGTAVVASLPAGALLDRTNSRSTMAAAVLVLFVAGAWGWAAARSGDYPSLLASRVAGGLAYVVVWNAGIDIVSRATGDAQRATAVGVFTASAPVGFALGQAGGPVVAGWLGWPAVFLAFDGLAAVGLLLFWPTSRGLGASSESAPTLGEFGGVLTNRGVWLVGGLGFVGYALYLFVNSWGPSYLTTEIGLSLGASGALVALFPAVGVLARVGSGVLSDRLFGGRRRPVALGAFLLAAPLVGGVALVRSIAVLVGALLVAGFAIQLVLGLSFTYVGELVSVRVAATAVAFQTSVGLAGAFVAPIVGGAIVDAAGYAVAFGLAGGLAAFGIALAWCAPEPAAARKDL